LSDELTIRELGLSVRNQKWKSPFLKDIGAPLSELSLSTNNPYCEALVTRHLNSQTPTHQGRPKFSLSLRLGHGFLIKFSYQVIQMSESYAKHSRKSLDNPIRHLSGRNSLTVPKEDIGCAVSIL
jgi:hypothetical protein